MLSLSFLALKSAYTLIVYHSDQVLFWVSESQDQKSLMHRRRSFHRWGNDHVTFIFTDNNGQDSHFWRM